MLGMCTTQEMCSYPLGIVSPMERQKELHNELGCWGSIGGILYLPVCGGGGEGSGSVSRSDFYTMSEGGVND